MDAPTFSRFHATPKCNPALLMEAPELLLDRPASRRWSIPEPTRETLLLACVLAVTVVIGWHSYQLRQIEAQIAQLVAIQATQAELKRIVGSEEAQALQAADQARAAVRR